MHEWDRGHMAFLRGGSRPWMEEATVSRQFKEGFSEEVPCGL